MATVAFYTLGCKVNHYESEAMMDLFKNKGYQLVSFNEKADIYIINSCTVTNEAARKSRQLSRRAKGKNPEAQVALVGCYSQVSPQEVAKITEIDLIIGTAKRSKIVELLENLKKEQEQEQEQENENKNNTTNNKTRYLLKREELEEFEELTVENLEETTRAFVKIEEGCNQFCSYCIIPYARGPVRSRKEDSVLTEVKELVAKGVKEIVLTGTHLGVYGYDWAKKNSLYKLLKKLLLIPNLAQIRLSSIEVTELNSELISLIAKESKICPHLHLPLQSGSKQILKAMKRPYTILEFQKKVEQLREKIKDLALTTDIIVGFPGEKEKLFQETYNFVKKMEFSRLHVFPFSARKGTLAAEMKEKVPAKTKKRYSKKLRQLNKELMLAYQKKFLGKERTVLIEEKRDRETNFLTGLTDNYLRVLIDNDDKYQGKLLAVNLSKSISYEKLKGEIMEREG